MSEAAKPVEEPVVAPEASVEAPAAETAPVETTEAATEAPAATEPATAEEAPAAPVKEEVKPVEEGTLGYKGPGLLKSFIFQKKFFWFGTEPVEHKSLTSYLRGEKQQELANKNAAWSTHTGKGLLYFSKKPTEKATPAGIINLSEVSDLTADGTVDFSFSLGGHKHTFQANTLPERDNWLGVLKTKVEEARELATSVVESETYKKSLGELTKPAVVAAAVPKKSVDVKEEKKEEKAEAKEEKKEEKKEVKEEKKEEKKEARKSRSASRKRNSIFGSFGLGKKEEKPEVAKEETPVAAATEEPAAPAEPVAAEPVVAAESATTEAAPATEAAVTTPTEAKPAPSKRNSIFGSLKSPFAKDKKSSTEAPVVPPKDAEPVSETAPVIPPVDTSETPAAAAETTEAPATNGETKVAETPAPKTRKGSSSLPWLSKKEKPATSDEEVEKPKSPFAKLRATVKGKTSPKAEKAAEKPAEAEAAKEETAASAEASPAVEEPVVSEPVPVVQQTPAPVAASA
jgi:hypothetical protein